jgi:hypothetical protein
MGAAPGATAVAIIQVAATFRRPIQRRHCVLQTDEMHRRIEFQEGHFLRD